MNKNGAIVVIDDDEDDQDLMKEIFRRLNYKNQVIYFSNSKEALLYFNDVQNHPFIIISDIKLPGMDGITLRNKLLENKERYGRHIPFILLTTGTQQKAVYDAFAMSVQGFFIKPMQLSALQNLIKTIIDYWKAAVEF